MNKRFISFRAPARYDSAPYKHVCGPALEFEVVATDGRARATQLGLPRGRVPTPVFMPVGTQGAIKGAAPAQLRGAGLDIPIMLGNTYHLGCRPGAGVLDEFNGLQPFQGWDRPVLTDSGGFQMVSLLHLAAITEQGVTFHSPVDGSELLLTPEESMAIQNSIGADIMMALDDVVDAKTVDAARFEEACDRTLRWIDRCIGAHKRIEQQNLFGIVQGGLDISPGGLRERCLRGMMERDENLPGYAIGGLAGGEEKSDFWRVVAMCCEVLPQHKPRYLMGVGYPLDIVVCSALGVDMYDCVFPTRTGRFGVALVPWGQLKLKGKSAAHDHRAVDPGCSCPTCATYSRAQLHVMFKVNPTAAAIALTVHNIAYMMALTREMQAAICAGQYSQFVQRFLRWQFPEGSHEVPAWVSEALHHVGIEVPAWDASHADAVEARAHASTWHTLPKPGAAGTKRARAGE